MFQLLILKSLFSDRKYDKVVKLYFSCIKKRSIKKENIIKKYDVSTNRTNQTVGKPIQSK